jgi:hypothetical protein
MTLIAVNESRPVVGSSKKMSEGLEIISTPMEVLFLSPPETPLNFLIFSSYLRSGPPILVF